MITSETKITDIHTLIKVMVCVNNEFGGQIWWRGNSDVDYLLQPSVFRPRGKDKDDYSETNINTRFMQKAPALRENLPAKDAWYDWLFLMQHYRLPTRLLDWTESPLIACYFAVNLDNEKKKCADGALFALSPYRLNFHLTGDSGLITPQSGPKFEIIAQRAFCETGTNKYNVLAILPNLIDQRMIAQLSVFTIHDNKESLESHQDSSDFLVKYEIPAAAKKLLREQLKHAGIRPSTIFPDLEHLSQELRDIREFQPSKKKPKEIDTERLRSKCPPSTTPN